jgi:NitT/TauT family transport system substrate-binding protein
MAWLRRLPASIPRTATQGVSKRKEAPMSRRISAFLPLVLLLALTAPAASSAADVRPPTEPLAVLDSPVGQARQEASLRLDWVPGAYHVGPALALERGYYDQEGISLRMGEGTGSAVTVQAVASGQDTFGFADAPTMALAVARGAPVRMVANTTQRSPVGVIYVPPTQIDRPQDLVGKTVGAAAGDAALTALPAVARLNGVDPNSYRVVSIEAATKIPALLERRVDTIVGDRFGDYLRAYVVNPSVRIQLYADWGVNTLGNGYITQDRTIRERPDLVRGFVRATLRGWQDAAADPQAGVAALMRQFPTTREDFVVAGLPLVIEHFYNEDSQGQPLGWTAERTWQQTVDILREYGGLEGNPPLNTLYTNEFIPMP